jgi:hypothetical protein
MNETFEKLCKKHSLSEHAKVEFRNLFEKEIVKVFNRKSMEVGKESTTKESIIKKITAKVKTTTSSDGICVGKKADGKPCTFKAKENGYCGRHNPDKSSSPKTAAKPRVKKNANECHATIPKTGKKCIQPGTIKPEGSDFHYCKRHSEKWVEFEPEQEPELVASEAEAEEVEEEVEEADAEEEVEEEAEEESEEEEAEEE